MVPGCVERYLPVYETQLLTNGDAQTLLAGARLYQARCKRETNLIRVIDTVAAAKAIFGQHLCEAEVRLGRVEIGQKTLVAERYINIKETGLKSLRELLSAQSNVAIECDTGVYAE